MAKKTDDFAYDKKTFCWVKNEGKESRAVTNFNIVFESIIRTFNADERVWERNYECYIEFKKDKKIITSPTFFLCPDDCLTPKNFQAAIWRLDFRQCWFKNDAELQWFFTFLNEFYQPRIVSQFDHFGFVDFERRRFYLARNVLVWIPDSSKENLRLIAPDETGCFHVEDNKYLKLDPNLDPAPHFDLGAVDDKTNWYQEDMAALFDNDMFDYRFTFVQDNLNNMVAGQIKGDRSGDVVLAYVFSYLFFEDIQKAFAHILFLYIYGQPSTGKGKLAEIILSFFGIPFTDSMTYPTKTALENNLASHSQVPAWIDEFKPELAGYKSHIPDQLFNTWFELRTRNISRYGNRKRNEVKFTRAMIMFCSNFLPETDHLNSRLIKLEYTTSKRGNESYYHALHNEKATLQRLFLSSLQWYQTFDRPFYRNLLTIYKSRIKKEVIRRLEQRKDRDGTSYNLEDRQVEQMATLCTTWFFITKRSDLKTVHRFYTEDLKEKERNALQQQIDIILQTGFYEYIVTWLCTNARQTAHSDPFSEFLQTVGYLVNDKTINEKHFTWTPEGDLKIWFGGVWSAYEKFKGNGAANKEFIRRLIDSVASNPGGSTQNWRITTTGTTVRQHGYRIPNAKQDKRFAFAFNFEDIVQGAFMIPEKATF